MFTQEAEGLTFWGASINLKDILVLDEEIIEEVLL
jgi:hypothetical protein